MKKLLLIIFGMFVFLFLFTESGFACSCCAKKAEAAQSASSCQNACSAGCGNGESACSEKSMEVKNTNCPVSGELIGSMGKGVSVTHNGKTYQLCCAGCIEKFKVDPEKYVQRVK